MIQFDEEVLDWIKTALKDSHDDERRYHREVFDKLQKDYQRVEQRLEAVYVDKLDGKSESDSTKRSPPNGGKSIRVLLSPTWTRALR